MNLIKVWELCNLSNYKKLCQKTDGLFLYYDLKTHYYYLTKQFRKALEYEDKACNILSESEKNYNYRFLRLLIKSTIYISMKKHNEIDDEEFKVVLKLLDKAKKYRTPKIDNKDKYNFETAEIYRLKYEYYNLTGDREKAYNYIVSSDIYRQTPETKRIRAELNPQSEEIIERYSSGILNEQEQKEREIIGQKFGYDSIFYTHFCIDKALGKL